MKVFEYIIKCSVAGDMLRRTLAALQRSRITCSSSACSNTQKLYYHPAITRWREIELDKNPFYDKYKDKLQHVISHVSQGNDGIENKHSKITTQGSTKDSDKVQSSQYSFTRAPQLDKIMKVELLIDKTADEITQIWKTYHSDKDSVCAIIPAKQYSEMISTAQHCPLFLHPVPRSEGFEMVFSQFDGGHYCYFTSLLNYKTHGDAAPVWLTLIHYAELLKNKGIVLMAGDVDTKCLSVLEAQFLANQIQLYYATGDKERHNLLQQFNHEPDSFDYTKLLELVPNSKSNK